VNVLFLSLALSHGMTYLVSYILLLLRTPSNGNFRLICFIRSSLQFNFILGYYEVTVLLHRLIFGCSWRTTSFYCIVLCIVLEMSGYSEVFLIPSAWSGRTERTRAKVSPGWSSDNKVLVRRVKGTNR